MIDKFFSVLRYATGQFHRDFNALAKERPVTVVLCYHRVTADQPPGFTDIEAGVLADVFEAQMRFMLAHFRPIRATEALADNSPGLRFAVTFDDGTRDNLEIAGPILKRLGIPATFFVVSDFVSTDRPYWWEELAALMRQSDQPAVDLHAAVSEVGRCPWPSARVADLSSAPSRLAATEDVAAHIRSSNPAALNAMMDAVAGTLGIPRRPVGRAYPLMDWDDLRELGDQGHDIGLHTATHPNLALADPACLEAELVGAAHHIEKELGSAPTSFAFPYGIVRDTDEKVSEILSAQTKVTVGFGTGPGLITEDSSQFILPRCLLNGQRSMVWAHNLMKAKASTSSL